jgi:hypothetical protein
MRFSGAHLVALMAVLLAALAVRATEVYTLRYQSLPVLDWLESRPPLVESADLPAASDLARGLSRAMPLLVISDDARPLLPVFGPPAVFQRTIGGVRDASRIDLGSPGTFNKDLAPVQAHLDVIVFNRALRAVAWSELMDREMDIRAPTTGRPQNHVSGPDEPDGVWIAQPSAVGGGVATVVGHRGPVGFMLQVTFFRPSTIDREDMTDLSARAESVARQAAASWSGWLAQQVVA